VKAQKHIHRRDAETPRKTKTKAKLESAEVAEGAERPASAKGIFTAETPRR
jgi:hypothetical protein